MALVRPPSSPGPSAALLALGTVLTAVILLPLPATPADPPAGSIRSKVEVVVRTIPVQLTDEKGNPVAAAPSLQDVEVREDGRAMEIVGIEPMLPEAGSAAQASAAAAATLPAGPKTAAPGSATASGRPGVRRTRQVVYVDTTFLRQRSVKDVSAALVPLVPKLLAIGPVEIVVADPTPRLYFPPTESASALEEVLVAMGKKVPGRDRVGKLRRESVTRTDNDPRRTGGFRTSAPSSASAANASQRGLIREEAAVLRDATLRLSRWAASFPVPEGGIVYLASDGFDIDQTIFYGLVDGDTVRREVMPAVLDAVERTAQSLQAGGWTTVSIALNAATDGTSTSNAEFTGRDRIYSTTDTNMGAFLVQHPLDPLRGFAEATGGEVLVQARQLPAAAERLQRRWLVSWRADQVIDGRLHSVEVLSLRPGLVAHAARALPAGTPEAASSVKALDALDGSTAEGGLPVQVALGKAHPTKKGREGATLTVVATLEGLKDLLARTEAPVMRVSVAVEVPGGVPFVFHTQRAVPRPVGKGWIYEAPIEWPEGATKMSVVAEELSTGSWGSALGSLPKS